MNDAALMSPQVETLLLEVERKLPIIFGANLVFGFVFGSIAKGYGKIGHDIDVFICLRKRVPEGEKLCRRWLRDLHQRYGMQVDETFPVEVTLLDDLMRIVHSIEQLRIEINGNSAETFDAVTWVEVLSGKKAAIVGDVEKLQALEQLCSAWPSIWKEQIMAKLQSSTPLALIRNVLRFEFPASRSEGKTSPGSKAVVHPAAIPPKRERLAEFYRLLGNMPAARTGLEAYMQIVNVLNMSEDEIFGVDAWNLPRTFITGATTERLYAPQPDNFEIVPGFLGVMSMVLKKEYIFVSRFGAIEIQRDDGSTENERPFFSRGDLLLFARKDAYGDGVWHQKNR